MFGNQYSKSYLDNIKKLKNKSKNKIMKILGKELFIGLMGVQSDGTLVTPNGKSLFKAPMFFARHIQSLQHSVARLTHRP